jgi:hypothetical protein
MRIKVIVKLMKKPASCGMSLRSEEPTKTNANEEITKGIAKTPTRPNVEGLPAENNIIVNNLAEMDIA